MDKNEMKHYIARRAARELKDDSVVILGIGIPSLCAKFIPEDVKVCACNDACVISEGPVPGPGGGDPLHVVNSGGGPSSVEPGGAFLDQAAYFGLVRGGHIDACVLGCLQCDARGSLASWVIPGRRMPGMGGSMDICTGTKTVIVAMEHTAKGEQKILQKCTLPITAAGCVDTIITEMGFMSVTEEGIILREINPEYTPEMVQEKTGARLIVAPDLKYMY